MSSIKLDREPAPKYTTEQPSTSQEFNKEDDIPAWICSKLQQAYVALYECIIIF